MRTESKGKKRAPPLRGIPFSFGRLSLSSNVLELRHGESENSSDCCIFHLRSFALKWILVMMKKLSHLDQGHLLLKKTAWWGRPWKSCPRGCCSWMVTTVSPLLVQRSSDFASHSPTPRTGTKKRFVPCINSSLPKKLDRVGRGGQGTSKYCPKWASFLASEPFRGP